VKTGAFTLYQSLKAIFLHIDYHEKALFSRHAITLPRFYILKHIHEHPGINYIDLTDLMLCTKSNTTRIVGEMQKDGLITRKDDPQDKRSFQLYLTQKGTRVYQGIQPEYLQQIDTLMSAFDPEEVQTFTAVSQQIEKKLAPAVLDAGGSK
jgi:DNA-binding MarR family transcriptional regulator